MEVAQLSSADPKTTIILLGGAAVVGFILLFIVLPLLGRFSLMLEAINLLAEPLGEYFGNPRVALLGCLVFLLIVVACCVLVFIAAGALLTCGTANPSQFCNLFRR